MRKARRDKAAAALRERKIDMAYVTSDADVRYLTGMPYGSVLFIFKSGKTILLPWDAILAKKIADADEILPYTDFGRDLKSAVRSIAERENLKKGSAIELPSDTTHLEHGALAESLTGYSVCCGESDLTAFLRDERMVKDEAEIAITRRACEMTDELIDEIVAGVSDGTIKTEIDVALHLEGSSRKRGAEAMGFETLAAGPERSFGIHAHPAYTASNFGTPGLSILDFGINLDGYTSDITLTVIRGDTTPIQEQMLSLVEEAYSLAASMVKPGIGTVEIAAAVDSHFAKDGFSMPHALGHGIGLEVHEAPILKSNPETNVILQPGMIITLEPGLYEDGAGGVRLENDFLVTETGSEVLTNSRLIRLR